MAGRAWARLAERRATALLGSVRGAGTALVVAPAGGFPPPPPPGAGDVSTGPFDVVIDASRPEEPADQARRLADLASACGVGGTLAAIACGGTAAGGGAGGIRTLAWLRGQLAAAGFSVVRLVPFDLLGSGTPWRAASGEGADRALAELDDLLCWPSARAAVRFLEREIVAALPPELTARVLVVARRSAAGGPLPPADPRVRLARPEVARRLLSLLRHDAVVRLAAFVDAEVLPPLGVRFDLARYLLTAGVDPAVGEPVRRRALARRRAWFPGLDARRFVEAVSHRVAARTVALLAAGGGDAATLAPSFEYAILEACHGVLDRHLVDPVRGMR